jgi:hypothetical protein
MSQSIKLWTDMVTEMSPLMNERTAELMFYRAATAWGSDQILEIADGTGGWVNLTKLFEQFKLIEMLKGNHNGKEE